MRLQIADRRLQIELNTKAVCSFLNLKSEIEVQVFPDFFSSFGHRAPITSRRRRDLVFWEEFNDASNTCYENLRSFGMDARQLRNLTAVTCLLATAAALTGCVSFPNPTLGWNKSSLVGKTAEVVKEGELAGAAAAPAGKYVIEIRDAKGKSSSAEFSLAGPLCVHDALQQAGAIQRFNRIKIELVRALPTGGWHRMPIEYDRGIRRVPAEVDYGLLSGDRLIVTEDTSTILSDMGDSAGDFFMSKPKSGKTKNGTFRMAG